MKNEKLLDQVDAMVFSGDSLYDKSFSEQFENYLQRWKKELLSIKEPPIENPIKIIKHIINKPVDDIGDIVYTNEVLDTIKGKEGWLSRPSKEILNTKQNFPLQILALNVWNALSKLGIDSLELKRKMEYTCFLTGNIYYGFMPLELFCRDNKFWTNRIELSDWKREFIEDHKWQRKMFNDRTNQNWNEQERHFNESYFYIDSISKSLLGHGYSDLRIPSDGSTSLMDAVVMLENDDIIGGKVWVWYNK